MVQYANPLDQYSGKSGGNVYRYDQCRHHIQSIGRKIKRRTHEQLMVRACFLDLKNTFRYHLNWRQQACWKLFAINHPQYNKKGERITLTAWHTFFHYNQPRWWNGVPPIWVPPGYELLAEEDPWYQAWKTKWLLLWGA